MGKELTIVRSGRLRRDSLLWMRGRMSNLRAAIGGDIALGYIGVLKEGGAHMAETPRDDPRPVLPLSNSPLELTYAPPARSKTRAVWVVAAGLLTTAITLAGVYIAKMRGKENIMGWYANYVIPIGAILVGLAASSGYAIASWTVGVKIRRGLLLVILGLMLLSYFAAEYVEFGGARYVQNGVIVQAGKKIPTFRRIGFWEYFDLKAVNWTWKKKNSYDTSEGEPLGKTGYAFVLLGITGFCFSGLLIPLLVSRAPYCDLCERYMKTKSVALFPALLPYKKISKKETAAQAQQNAENQRLFEQATARLVQLVAHAQAGDVEGYRRDISQPSGERKSAGKLLRRLEVHLMFCPLCSTGRLQPAWLTGQGKQLTRTALPKVDLAPEFVREVTKRSL